MSEASDTSTTKCIENVAEHYDADILFYSGEINYGGLGKLIARINPLRKNVLLILVTNGGIANAAYQIARALQKFWGDGEFLLYLPSYCKSAGTLVALGANRLLVDSNSELGPLDVQLIKQDEIAGRRSGLLSRSTFDALEGAAFSLFEHFMLNIKSNSGDTISFKLAADLSSRIVGSLISPIYGQISPDIVGSDWRDLEVAFQYGMRLISVSRNSPPETVWHLVHRYPSHDFVIDEDEIRILFSRVDTAHQSVFTMMDFVADLVGDSAYNEDEKGIVIDLSRLAHQANVDGEASNHATDNNEQREANGDEDQSDSMAKDKSSSREGNSEPTDE